MSRHVLGGISGAPKATYGQNAATKRPLGMNKAQVVIAIVALTWAFVWSRLSESNRRPIHYE
jgi:hypothetical protein